MNANINEAHGYITRAREALFRGDKLAARMLGEQAALTAPELEDAWLILAASDENPDDALAYAKKALELAPDSPRARKAVEWAEGKARQAHPSYERVEAPSKPAPRAGIPVVHEARAERKSPEPKRNNRLILYAGALGLLVCVAFVFAAWMALSSPAFASVFNAAPSATPENLWARADVPKPSVTPLDAEAPVAQAQATSTPAVIPATGATEIVPPTSSPEPISTPTAIPTDAPTNPPVATETPGVLAMDIVADTPTSAYVPPTAAPPAAPAPSNETRGGARWIDVDLTNQMVYAYEGDTIVNSFVVSTGTAMTPTVTGKFKIWIKLKSTDMSGPGYYLPDVPYTMYFYKGYGLHGTYWHSNFGTPMSHGCVNLSIPDAEWLFYWASEGTVVNVHY